ncbi:MAG: hypothetical protein HQK53_13110 [Oligoflexia bacterium]|nr:hypothetical protein [Oligoflexia bacterium]
MKLLSCIHDSAGHNNGFAAGMHHAVHEPISWVAKHFLKSLTDKYFGGNTAVALVATRINNVAKTVIDSNFL